MHCTHCGTPDQQSKAYCRQCGKRIGFSPPESRMAAMIFFNALSAVFGAASAIALFSNKGAEWAINLAGIFCIVISVYQTISFLVALNLRMRLKREKGTSKLHSTGEPSALNAGDTSQFVGRRSVTENTTALLERKK